MRVVVASLVVAAVGVIATRSITLALVRRGDARDAHVYWALGLVALVPGWVVAFVALLGAAPIRRPEMGMAISWTVSTALALIGAIVTEAVVRRADDEGRPRAPEWQWRIGTLALVPALVVALLGHAFR